MDVSVRELRNHTGDVIKAVESGVPVTLTVHGRPVADIVPRVERAERRPIAQVVAELEEVRTFVREHGVKSDPADYDLGYTTDDL